MVQGVIGSILLSGPIDLFLIPASVPVCGMVHMKDPSEVVDHEVVAAWILSHYLNGP